MELQTKHNRTEHIEQNVIYKELSTKHNSNKKANYIQKFNKGNYIQRIR